MQRLGQQSRRAYIRDLREVIEQADVILEVRGASPQFSRPLSFVA
jgi:hypothetical protein